MNESSNRLLFDITKKSEVVSAGINQSYPASDTYGAGFFNSSTQSESKSHIVQGFIVDFHGGPQLYKINYGHNSVGWATLGGLDSGFRGIGMRPVSTLPVGTRVEVLINPSRPEYGIIINTVPFLSTTRAYSPADAWWPIMRSGHSADSAHRATLDSSMSLAKNLAVQPEAIELMDASAGRPIDSTSVGEWGVQADTGMWFGGDPFNIFMRASESTGIFVFYKNHKLRLAATNSYEFWSAEEEKEVYEYSGEIHGVSTKWIYPWEGVGLWRVNQVTPSRGDGSPQPGHGIIYYSSNAVQSGSGNAVIDAESESQVPAGRSYEYSGYLGQGLHTVTALPMQWPVYKSVANDFRNSNVTLNTNGQMMIVSEEDDVVSIDTPSATSYVYPADRVFPEGSAVNRSAEDFGQFTNLENLYSQPGVLDETKNMAGGYYLRSGRRIAIVRRPAIPTPRRRLRPNDPAFNFDGEYKSNGLDLDVSVSDAENVTSATISGAVGHKVTGDLDVDYGSRQRVAASHDALSYIFNWENLHPFAYRYKEWHTVEEKDIKALVTKNQTEVAQLGNQDVPNYSDLATNQYLDDPVPMYLDVDHRYGETKYYPNESGLILHEDGSLNMYDGSGSELNMLQGMVHVTASGDIVFRPGRNFIVEAGHDVIIKGRDSVDISTSRKDIRIKSARNLQEVSGTEGCGGILLESQSICPGFDFADDGEEAVTSGIVMLARQSNVMIDTDEFFVNVDGGRAIINAGDEGIIKTSAKYVYEDLAESGAKLTYFGSTGVHEYTATRYLTNASIYTASNFVTSASSTLKKSSTINSRVSDYLLNTFRADLDEMVYIPDEAYAAEVTLRKPEEYLTDTNYEMWAARWQIMAENDNQTLPVWSEPLFVSSYSGTQGRPYPGDAWVDTTFYTQQLQMTDPNQKWTAKNRMSILGTVPSSVFTIPEIATPMVTSPETSYTTVVNLD